MLCPASNQSTLLCVVTVRGQGSEQAGPLGWRNRLPAGDRPCAKWALFNRAAVRTSKEDGQEPMGTQGEGDHQGRFPRRADSESAPKEKQRVARKAADPAGTEEAGPREFPLSGHGRWASYSFRLGAGKGEVDTSWCPGLSLASRGGGDGQKRQCHDIETMFSCTLCRGSRSKQAVYLWRDTQLSPHHLLEVLSQKILIHSGVQVAAGVCESGGTVSLFPLPKRAFPC